MNDAVYRRTAFNLLSFRDFAFERVGVSLRCRACEVVMLDGAPGPFLHVVTCPVGELLGAGPVGELPMVPGERRSYRGESIVMRHPSEVGPDWLAFTVVPGYPRGFATELDAREWIDRRLDECSAPAKSSDKPAFPFPWRAQFSTYDGARGEGGMYQYVVLAANGATVTALWDRTHADAERKALAVVAEGAASARGP